MSEYWKSTPRYWCKYCAVYVRDTKLERANHESTAKHQGAIKRSLRDLHRSHDRDERDKERAKREIERLNGVVASGSSASSAAAPSTSRPHAAPSTSKPAPPPAVASEASLKKQREQLAELGVAIPSSFRPEMAMPGEWTVTSTRVVETRPRAAGGEGEGAAVEARASGVRKREENEEEKEEEEAVRGLFKKPRRWGRDSKAAPEDEEEAAELDALLSGSLAKKQPAAEDGVVKLQKGEGEDGSPESAVKKEELDVADSGIAETIGKSEDAGAEVGAVVFKKRKPKGLRTK
ncbi:Zinc finger, U1-C type [Cordyceps fumosorosea ARSEF 2679]|uniref:Zinc finger, U1-C type n=1 Tax=Cordyceps fumosorosea (strain ARSEF 2679) TaxID=1081104 RepID=A0A168ARL3_CORFA|nr:Zinc finger, U1-C type [Cordyceps fumosorosea ARSEF 2679]OAA69100.1 Zinc finger, U1-C type [Cordyceps fumosorosea ARSEF 2679]